MARQRVPLNLYLLKAGATPADVARVSQPVLDTPEQPASDGDLSPERTDLEDGSWIDTWVLDEQPHRAPLPDDREVAASMLLRGTPVASGWQAFVQSVVPDAPVGSGRENYGALLFQVVGTDLVVWSFGNAWPLIDVTQTVERFGLRVALNALLATPPPTSGPPKQVGVRGLTSAIRAAVVRKSTVVAARPAKPTSFERVDQSSDAAAVAEVTTHHAVFDRAAGGRSLRFEAPVSSLGDLQSYAKEALRLHRRKDYTKDAGYRWIDYTVPVSDRGEVDAVLDEIVAAARGGRADFDVVWADTNPNTGLTPQFVCFPRARSGPGAALRKELTWAIAWDWLKKHRPTEPGHESLRTRLRFFDAPGQPPSLEVELWQLLVAQVAVKKNTYLVSDGEVWRASPSHIADIDNLLAPYVVVNPTWLPRFKPGEDEATYNARAAAQPGHVLLDKQLVRLPGETPFEPCDVLSADGRFMHVKRKTGSATMSHVVAQALASTQLLRTNSDARDLLDATLRGAKPAPARLTELRDHCASFASRPTGEVDVVIIGTWRGAPDASQLPLLTRISLNSWVRQMPCPRGVALVGP